MGSWTSSNGSARSSSIRSKSPVGTTTSSFSPAFAGYRRELTDALLYEERVLYETYNKGLSIVPTADLPFYRITWDLNRAEKTGGVFDEHAPLVEELLERIRADGHLSSTDIAPRAAIDWYWRPTNQVRAILEALAQSGILGIARRDGNRRIYDLVERLFPADILAERPSGARPAALQAPVALPRPRPAGNERPGRASGSGRGPEAAPSAGRRAARS